MSARPRARRAARACLALAFAAACGEPEPEVRLTLDSPVGVAAGEPVTLADVESKSGGSVSALWFAMLRSLHQAALRRVDEVLLADATAGSGSEREARPPTPEVVARFRASQRGLPPSAELADAIAAELVATELARQRRAREVAAQRESARIEVFLPDEATDGEPIVPAVVARVRPAGPDAPPVDISREDVLRDTRLALFRERARVFAEARRQLHAISNDRLFDRAAERRGVTPRELLASLANAVEPVTREDAQEYFDEHREELREFHPMRIYGYLASKRQAELVEQVIAPLREEAPPVLLLEEPVPPRFEGLDDADEGLGSLGPRDAPVSLVVFSNLRCEHCERAERALDRVLATPRGERVRVVWRSLHPRAALAAHLDARAARCAAAAGAFPAFRRAMLGALEGGADVDPLAVARGVVSDPEAFGRCVREDATRDAVRADLEAAAAIGLHSAPAFLVNGLAYVGFQGEGELVRAIDAELEAGSRGSQ